METILSIIATIVSSIALIAVAVGLILQGRQLSANRIQIMREMHLELMKVGMENPELGASVYEYADVTEFAKMSLINFTLKFLETGYSLKTISEGSVTLQAAELFRSEFTRTCWATGMRKVYEAEAGTRMEREFFSLVDSAFQDVDQALQSTARPTANPSIKEGGKE
jgi:hypothetical protein